MLTLAATFAAAPAAACGAGDGCFSATGLNGWRSKSFAGETDYQLVEDNGRQVVRAESRGTASGLYRKVRVDLGRTPWLSWSWRVANVLDAVDERSKAGDDYPARVYVVVSGGLTFWNTRSLVYVWSSAQPQGSHWHNAFTGNARVIALRSGTGDAGRWVTEKRNVAEDFALLFDESISHIDGVALMTDTDNSGQSALAWYGDIVFTQR